jgi:hypothetical protein
MCTFVGTLYLHLINPILHTWLRDICFTVHALKRAFFLSLVQPMARHIHLSLARPMGTSDSWSLILN